MCHCEKQLGNKLGVTSVRKPQRRKRPSTQGEYCANKHRTIDVIWR